MSIADLFLSRQLLVEPSVLTDRHPLQSFANGVTIREMWFQPLHLLVDLVESVDETLRPLLGTIRTWMISLLSHTTEKPTNIALLRSLGVVPG
jgi:hypothetical protein